jgi:hypothetical protein
VYLFLPNEIPDCIVIYRDHFLIFPHFIFFLGLVHQFNTYDLGPFVINSTQIFLEDFFSIFPLPELFLDLFFLFSICESLLKYLFHANELCPYIITFTQIHLEEFSLMSLFLSFFLRTCFLFHHYKLLLFALTIGLIH